MAGRSNTTLKKRQKEMARAEKQREKFARRLEKKKGILGEPGEAGEAGEAGEDAGDSAEVSVGQPAVGETQSPEVTTGPAPLSW